MQWLIDLVIEAIGIPPCYIDRGDPAARDYEIGDLTLDGAWHELDLSAIVPAGATAVHFATTIRATLINKDLNLRTLGNVNTASNASMRTTVANLVFYSDKVVACDEDRKIEYSASPAGINILRIHVKGWWL